MIIDNGSTDTTLQIAEELAAIHDWIQVVEAPQALGLVRGGPIVHAFHVGIAHLVAPLPDVVVKLDADTSMEPEYFERLLTAFAAEPSLGIASGACVELSGGQWRQQHMTGDHVWGASRAYRWQCLQDVLPLEERMGWDGVDALKANLDGWKTRTLTDLEFRHHRLEGERDGARRNAFRAQGRASHFMGYRPSYVVLRAILGFRRERAALAMIGGYLGAAVRRDPRCGDPRVVAYLREQQRLRHVPVRAREALGRRSA